MGAVGSATAGAAPGKLRRAEDLLGTTVVAGTVVGRQTGGQARGHSSQPEFRIQNPALEKMAYGDGDGHARAGRSKKRKAGFKQKSSSLPRVLVGAELPKTGIKQECLLIRPLSCGG